ncbi:chitin-binding domain-containing protein, partial [Halalkalibacter flavus]|uniref:chitin-binding domain-containing protein n=1 Tax=Halalkalibacter flavus TaxID=3090668 RepID=UPI003D67F3D4
EPTEKPEPTKEAEPTKETDPTTTTTPTEPPTCKEGERRPDTTDCHKYTECKNGAWKEDSCFWFRKFDSVTLKCMWWGATCAK